MSYNSTIIYYPVPLAVAIASNTFPDTFPGKQGIVSVFDSNKSWREIKEKPDIYEWVDTFEDAARIVR